jgi:hypothetical protein
LRPVLAVAVLLVALSSGSDVVGAKPLPCAAAVHDDVLPAWARTGFSDPRPRMPHAVGREGRIAAIVFGTPLTAPPAADHNNKILWVSRVDPRPGSPLRISAQRMLGASRLGAPVRRVLDTGPGPSIVDLPKPGCWRLTLRWSGRLDTIDLRYVTGP